MVPDCTGLSDSALFNPCRPFGIQRYLVSLGTATGTVPDCTGLSDSALFSPCCPFGIQRYLVSLGAATGMVPDCTGLFDSALFSPCRPFGIHRYLVSLGAATGMVPGCTGLSDSALFSPCCPFGRLVSSVFLLQLQALHWLDVSVKDLGPCESIMVLVCRCFFSRRQCATWSLIINELLDAQIMESKELKLELNE